MGFFQLLLEPVVLTQEESRAGRGRPRPSRRQCKRHLLSDLPHRSSVSTILNEHQLPLASRPSNAFRPVPAPFVVVQGFRQSTRHRIFLHCDDPGRPLRTRFARFCGDNSGDALWTRRDGEVLSIDLVPDKLERARAICGELLIVMHGVELSIGSALHWRTSYIDVLDRLPAVGRSTGTVSISTIRPSGDDQRPLSIGVPLPLPSCI